MWLQILCARLMTRAVEVFGNVGSRRPAAGKVSQTAHISSGDSTDALFHFFRAFDTLPTKAYNKANRNLAWYLRSLGFPSMVVQGMLIR